MARKTASLALEGDGLRFAARSGSGHTIALDDASGDTGMRPAELVPLAVAGCTAMDVISILKKKRQDVTGFEVRAHGLRADDYPKVFTDITLEYVVRGHNIDPKAVERSIELSETKYCSVMGTLKKAANISTTYRVEGAE